CLLSALHRPFLHSFPTRRSSDLLITSFIDLWVLTASLAISAALEYPMIGLSAVTMLIDFSAYSLAFFSSAFRPETHFSSNTLRADRKSTRLNSSHGSISYAVFCL